MAKTQIAIVGSETLLGKELEEVVKGRGNARIATFSATGEGNFGESDGEAVYVEPFAPAAIATTRAVLFAGTAEGAQTTFDVVQASSSKPLLVDCTGLLENHTEARIVSPLVAAVAPPARGLVELAHPAATLVVATLARLARTFSIRQAIAHVFEPASEQGRRGVSELHQQTTGLLTFKPLEKQIFDAQLSFNLLSQYGEEGVAKLAPTEQRIERHIASLIAESGLKIPMPSLRLVGAPVFHGYSVSLWVELDRPADPQTLAEALASAQIEVRSSNEEPPTSAEAAGQSGLIAGDLRADRNNPRAAWFWIVADNLRLLADAAADLVTQVEVAGS